MSEKKKEILSYGAAHLRLRRRVGRAGDRVCKCGAPAREWAYISSANEIVDARGRRYSANPADYTAMCKPCHRRFDAARITHCPHGHEYAGANLIQARGRRVCRACERARTLEAFRRRSPEETARLKEMGRQRDARRTECPLCGADRARGSMRGHFKRVHGVDPRSMRRAA